MWITWEEEEEKILQPRGPFQNKTIQYVLSVLTGLDKETATSL